MMVSCEGKKPIKDKGKRHMSSIVCRYYFHNFGRDACGNGLPVTESYRRCICTRSPEKCPVFLWKFSLINEK